MELTQRTIHTRSIHANQKWYACFDDIKQGILSWRIWLLLAWQDIRIRYRRSHLGPFWITISMAITIYSMGFLYGHLFRLRLSEYFPFLAAGMLTWSLISTLLTDGADAFIMAESYLKQIKLPYSVFILRVVCRNLIIFLHNIVVIIPIVIFFHVSFDFADLIIIPDLVIIALAGFFWGTFLATICTRYRDLAQIITNFIQVSFFLTPVMWNPSVLPKRYHYIVDLNPFAQFVELIRKPLMGTMPSEYAFLVCLGVVFIGAFLAVIAFYKARTKIIYWF